MSLSPLQLRIKEVYELMRDYQKDVFRDMVRSKCWLNYMKMGMGKTLTTMTAILYTESFPCIIICTKSAMGVWQDELEKWYGEGSVIYAGKPKDRQKAWSTFCNSGCKFIITNYRLASELGERFGIAQATTTKGSKRSGTLVSQPPHPGTPKGLIADEIQRGGLFNHKTATYKVFQKLCKVIPSRYLLTGTPYRRGVVDFFGPLSLVAPDKFDSYWKFIGDWCTKFNDGFGATVDRNPKDAVAFRAMIRQYASILNQKDHLHELPGKIRQRVPIELDDEQAKVYNELMVDMFSETESGELIMAPIGVALLVKLRLLLACPQELGLKTRGTAIDTILEMSEELVDEKKPFVIFTPFKLAVKHVRQALKDAYPDIRDYCITGDLSAEEFTRTWQGFQNADSGTPRVLICVIRSGASFHATCADTAFFLGYEWDFNENEQAEDRLNRMGQKKLVTCYYPVYRGTVDELVIQRLNDKTYGANLVLSNEQVFQAMITQKRS